MIEMNDCIFERGLNLEPDLSCHDILLHFFPKSGYLTGVDYDYRSNMLIIKEPSGNAKIKGNQLLYFPVLAESLRSQKNYPIYKVIIDLKDFTGMKDKGMIATLECFKRLSEILAEHKQQKAKVDANVNNLIMFHCQKKIMPLYQGSKPYYCNQQFGPNRQGTSFLISGIRYYTNVFVYEHRRKSFLYRIEPNDLFTSNLKSPAGNDKNDYQNYKHVKHISGGIMNTPILILRCAKTREHRGKHYFIDLHQNLLLDKYSDAKTLAKEYAGQNFIIDIFED